MEEGVCENDNIEDPSILDAQDISDHEKLIIKGDVVGNTAYSAKWILKTLLRLSKVEENPEDPDYKWSEDFETDLCYLWDMTTEKDIVNFLIENNYLTIAELILKIPEHHRLKEIIIGIIGNMCSQSDFLLEIANMNDLIETVLIHLTSPDTETLIQILRILQAAMWDVHGNDSSKWREILIQCKFLGQTLIFILESSTNEILLTATLTLLQSIAIVESNDNLWLLHELFQTEQLISGLKSSVDQLISSSDEDYTENEEKNIKNSLDIVSNLLEKQQDTNINNYSDIIDILLMLLRKENIKLIPLDETKALTIYKCIENIYWFQRKNYRVNLKDIYIVVIIMEKLNSAMLADSDNETIKELLHYIMRYWLKITGQYNDTDINELFELCPSETKKYLLNFTTDNSSVDLKL